MHVTAFVILGVGDELYIVKLMSYDFMHKYVQ